MSQQPTLKSLSRELPNQAEIDQIVSQLVTESDRGAALVAGTLLEAGLKLAIACRFAQVDASTMKTWFEGSDAPIATFSSKIRIARGLAIFGPETQKKLMKIKDVRNAFAHALKPIDFSNPTLISACEIFTDERHPEKYKHPNGARVRYCATCIDLFQEFLKDSVLHGGREMVCNLP